ncbi:MAG: T9SS type A sorting domain-containing protein [Flavobacteriales bacterium]|nr:T9SS type A sorting domain-containing protein [Flavobacteriales bacterium]
MTMKASALLFIAITMAAAHSKAQYTYTQVLTGLADVYESGNTVFALGDIDADGDVDIISVGDHWGGVVANEMGIMVFKNNGNGTAWTKTMSGVHGYGGVALGDVNNDGDMDVAYGVHHAYGTTDFGDQFLEVVLGDGTGLNWTPWDDGLAEQGQSWGLFGCDLADVDNDGLLDLGANSFGCCDGSWVYKNNGNGTWTSLGGSAAGFDNSSEDLLFGDFDGDGRPDFIVNNTAFNTQPYQVWRNTGSGAFAPMQNGLPYSGAWGDFNFEMAVADVDHDGADDIAITLGNYVRVYSYDPSTSSWVNISTGLPTTSQSGLLVALGDMGQDGHVDVVTYKSNLITIYEGDGAGSWMQAATLPIPETTGYVLKVADLDHNGYSDIVYWANPGSGNRLRVYLQSTPATQLSIAPVDPNGGQCFVPGSAGFIHWTSMVPSPGTATVDIELSIAGPFGPFTSIVSDAPNSGTHQWQIPAVSSNDCYLRFTIDDGMTTVQSTSAAAFSIDGCDLNTSVSDIDGGADMIIWPNPSEGMIQVHSAIAPDRIHVRNALGALIVSAPGRSLTTIDLSAYPAGLYFVDALFKDGTRSKKVVKTE